MFRFISKSLLKANLIRVNYIRTLSTQCLNSISEKQSLTISYLTNTCGVPLSRAVSASKHFRIENTQNADLVLQLFREHGCSSSELSSITSSWPRVICADPVKTLKPKIEYFESLGLTGSSLFKVFGSQGHLLRVSLKNHIIPNVDLLREVLMTNSDLVSVLHTRSSFLRVSNKLLKRKVSILVSCGVPRNGIRMLILQHPRSIERKTEIFEELVNKVLQMGIEPIKKKFVFTVGIMAERYYLWDSKRELLMSFGWSEAEFLSAFIKQPLLLTCSEKKIRVMMEFYLNKVGLEASDVARCPNILHVSLEKRVIPRCSVINVLKEKGLIKKDLDVVWILNASKKVFENRFVNYYKGYSAEVMKAYQSEMGFRGFSSIV